MTPEDLIASVDEAACLARLADMVQHKSYSETEEELVLARHMRDILEELGLEAQLQPVEGERVNAIGTLRGTGGGKSLLFNGHLDTNPVTTGWTVDPWGGVIDEEFIYGIGVSNMKAGDAAYLCAVETILKAGLRPKGDVILSFVVGELQGGIGTVRMLEQGVRADYFVNSEPTDIQALTLHSGAFSYQIELTGDTRHVSKRHEACDALAAAAALVPRINKMTFTGAKTADHKAVNRGHVGVVRAGLGDTFEEWRPPQVADRAKILGTCRYAPSQSIESVMEDMRAQLRALELEFPGLQWTLDSYDLRKNKPQMPPFEVSRDSEIVKVVNQAYEAVRGMPQPTGPIAPPCFFGTDAAHLAAAGMEGIVCGPGGEFNTMPDERVRKSQFIDCVKIYILTIAEICGLEPAA
ncbi:M20/M25/M40 family metallo-hydrolase [Pseudooceanicola sp. CBS1P-1]|uniref:M20/M25/M40 family metallo-hydrolase n=1 Tax=Pseudooceanicola albus TaxID=2692189 RepID=A0A6L7FXM4_9RHOB|nr:MULTISPECIES: M20/M25/M40 family metallo-hydrolase [Pseudooceanicola]MBT9383162.1 M20/M25/M40 family metallo-hydrolase [Pseudooceanicola endophyticus]MXN16515.1 M20/M25/M40 family metallo-hydrolase [Pseudooceanicola albus]